MQYTSYIYMYIKAYHLYEHGNYKKIYVTHILHLKLVCLGIPSMPYLEVNERIFHFRVRFQWPVALVTGRDSY